jgi:hypothetical protein
MPWAHTDDSTNSGAQTIKRRLSRKRCVTCGPVQALFALKKDAMLNS